MAELNEIVSDGVRAVEQWLSGLTVADWVLLALGAAALAWIVTGVKAMTRLGPIEIKPLEEDSDAKQPIKGLTAVMARRLHKCGLISPSEVPAGAPQADLIAAVEASPVPHANWLASILKAAPRPRPASYAVGGTVVTTKSGTKAGLGFWVRPVHEGRETQGFIPGGVTRLEHAATRAADKAYLHIVDDAAELLPLWARWSCEDAFAAYMDGIEAMADDQDLDGARHLNEAAVKEPTNLLIRLQFANLLERTRAGVGDSNRVRALKYARALNAYLRVAKVEPTVVEARYRASVLAAMLANCIVCEGQPYLGEVADALPMIPLPIGPPGGKPDNGEEAETVLNALSKSESTAVLQLLRPWYTLLHEWRPPHQLEMVGMDRRRLRNTVRISRHCAWLRKRGPGLSGLELVRAWWRWSVVRWLVLRGVGWHGHYNAACFDTLLYQRLRERKAR